MTPDDSPIEIGGIRIEVVRKAIRHLHLRVYPPDGRVRVSVPHRVNDESVRRMVRARLAWIHRQRARLQKQTRPPEPEMITGEEHAYFGRRYRLEVTEQAAPASVRLRDEARIELRIRPGTGTAKRRELLDQWYRSELKRRIPERVAAWEPLLGVRVADWGVKRMRTLWGSCNIIDRRIWLNLELARRPPHCLDYVVLHEMVHLIEKRHNTRFRALMDAFMPDWRVYRDELNHRSPAHE